MNILNRSSLKTEKGIPYFEIPELASIGWVQHGFLTRKGGVSLPPYDSLNLGFRSGDRLEHVSQNRNFISTAFHFDPEDLILLNQRHQDQIFLLEESLDPLLSPLECDAVVTCALKRILAIRTADCIPIFIVDRRKRAIAAIHAGRQGTGLYITTKVLRKMKDEFGCLPEDLLIAAGPSIGPCCYEVDENVFQPEWGPFSVPRGRGKWMVDLARINVAQMKNEGIKEEQIFLVDLCTSCHADLFFSHRKEGQTGRQLSFIGMK